MSDGRFGADDPGGSPPFWIAIGRGAWGEEIPGIGVARGRGSVTLGRRWFLMRQSAGNDELPVPEGLEPGPDQPAVPDPGVVERDEVGQLEERELTEGVL